MGTQPDINVRPAARPAARSARHPGLSPLARLLLGTSLKLVFLFAVTSSTPACVLPVSPEFQDPPGGPNAAPEISDPNFFPATAVASITGSQTFSFRVADPNNDTLFVRWVADLDPYSVVTTRKIGDPTVVPPSANGSSQPVERIISCGDLSAQSTHQIVAAVADRMFRNDLPSDPLALVDTAGKKSIIVWTLTLTCPMSQSP